MLIRSGATGEMVELRIGDVLKYKDWRGSITFTAHSDCDFNGHTTNELGVMYELSKCTLIHRPSMQNQTEYKP